MFFILNVFLYLSVSLLNKASPIKLYQIVLPFDLLWLRLLRDYRRKNTVWLFGKLHIHELLLYFQTNQHCLSRWSQSCFPGTELQATQSMRRHQGHSFNGAEGSCGVRGTGDHWKHVTTWIFKLFELSQQLHRGSYYIALMTCFPWMNLLSLYKFTTWHP